MPSQVACSSLINDAQHQGGCANLPTSLGENPVFVAAVNCLLDQLQAFRRVLVRALSGMHIANWHF
jgi:hypothetical protein